MTELFVIYPANSPWGDYGNILIHGMASLATDGRLQIERTAPFIPPISLPGLGIVVTEDLRRDLEKHAFTGFEFREAIKHKIVRLDWHLWDRQANEPARYPAGGEPENYILGRKHNSALAEGLGTLWELWVPERPGLQIEGGSTVDLSKYQGQDIGQASRWGYTYVSARLKEYLEKRAGEWISFAEAPTQEAA